MLVIYTSPILVWTNKVSPMICQTSTIRTVPIVVWNHCWDGWWNGRRASNSKWAPIAMFQNTLKKPLILLWIDTHPRGNESMLFHRFWHNSIKIYWFHQNISWYLHFQHRWLAHSCIWGNNRREIAWTEENKQKQVQHTNKNAQGTRAITKIHTNTNSLPATWHHLLDSSTTYGVSFKKVINVSGGIDHMGNA